jgi:hypothetical protein
MQLVSNSGRDTRKVVQCVGRVAGEFLLLVTIYGGNIVELMERRRDSGWLLEENDILMVCDYLYLDCY